MNTPIGLCDDVAEDVVANIICIIDKSGSMGSVRSDTIGSFNVFVEEQKQMPGKANLTVVFFNHEMEVWYSGKLENVPELTTENYVPDGMTALFDAICNTVDEMKTLKSALLVILTDGEENASKKYKDKDRVKTMVEDREKGGWTVVYLGANQDSFSEGVSMGVSGANTMNFMATSSGMIGAFRGISSTTTSYRTSQYNNSANYPIVISTTADNTYTPTITTVGNI